MTNTDSRYRRNNIIKRILTRIPLICFCTCGYLYGSNDGDIEIYKKCAAEISALIEIIAAKIKSGEIVK